MKPTHLLVFLGASLALAPVFNAQAQAPADSVVVGLRETDQSYAAEGVVEAVRQATVAAQVQGRVVEVRADAGQRVRQGELLMRLDTREAAENAAGARAQLIQAEANYQRTRDLQARKFVSAAALDKAEADLKAARALAGASGATLSHGTVSAPLAGLVAQRHTELGELAAPGKPLITVYDPTSLRVVASVPQAKLAEVRKASRARLEFPEAGLSLAAARIEVLPTADSRSHTVTVRLYLPADAASVIPGMAARAHFLIGSAPRLTVPPQAVIRRGEVTGVYVLDGQNQPRLRQVRLGEPAGNGELEVLAGLKDGDRVSLEPIQAGIRLKQTAK